MKDIAMLDKMYQLNLVYFKELSMYILAGKKKLAEVRANELQQAMVDQFAQKIDITNSQQVLQYGSACQKKTGDFSEAALSKVCLLYTSRCV